MIIQIIFLLCLIVLSMVAVDFNLALFTEKRDDVSFLDIFRLLPNKYGLMWWLTKPDVYFKKKYVRHIFFLYRVFIISFCFATVLFLFLLINKK